MNDKQASFRRLDTEVLQELLETQYFGVGQRLVFKPTVASTNTIAMQLALQGSEEGTVVLTDSQTAGKGRLGRRWLDMAGCNVLSSTILRPHFPPYLLVMIASLAIVDTIAEICAVNAAIKWPNDILIEEHKVAGILIETSHDRTGEHIAIMGIGVNVNGQILQYSESIPASIESGELIQRATTLEAVCGYALRRETFIASLLRYLEATYLALQEEALHTASGTTGSISRFLRERWRSQLTTPGRSVEIRQGTTILSGIAEDVNETGELLLRLASGKIVSVTWGDVWHTTSPSRG